jgi:formamidopyrimidine-DNA glycosylase
MPELPEVEALASFLRARAVGLAIARIDVGAIHVLKTYDPPPSALAGSPVTGVARHGKFLDLDVDGIHLVTHLSRAGWLRWSDQLPTAPLRPSGKGPIALRVHLEGGSGFDLTEAGTQKRLAVYVVQDLGAIPGIARLGVDVLADDFTPDVFAGLLAAAKGTRLKTVLTDQSVLAGVGNAYSDEVLWVCRLSPFTPCSSLTPEKVTLLYDALRTTLTEAVARAEGLPAKGVKAEKKAGLAVHGRTGLPCPRCGDAVREISFAAKSWQYCATCQTGGQPLADRRLSRLLR